VREYKASLELDVHQVQLWLNLGSTYIRQGRTKSALNAFEIASKEDPQSSAAWEQIGLCHFMLHDYDKSMSAYEKSVELNPRSDTAYRGLGVVCMTKYVIDGRNEPLRDRGLDAWHCSLEIKPDQQDLVRLVQKYSPKTTQPEL